VPKAVCSQEPPAAHLPSFPHGAIVGHCPAGAVVPAMYGAQVPFAIPVTAMAQPRQVPLHVPLQQKPFTQLPLEHWLAPAHAAPCPSLATHAPPEQ
jgi:hypothetical protein